MLTNMRRIPPQCPCWLCSAPHRHSDGGWSTCASNGSPWLCATMGCHSHPPSCLRMSSQISCSGSLHLGKSKKLTTQKLFLRDQKNQKKYILLFVIGGGGGTNVRLFFKGFKDIWRKFYWNSISSLKIITWMTLNRTGNKNPIPGIFFPFAAYQLRSPATCSPWWPSTPGAGAQCSPSAWCLHFYYLWCHYYPCCDHVTRCCRGWPVSRAPFSPWTWSWPGSVSPSWASVEPAQHLQLSTSSQLRCSQHVQGNNFH